MPNIFIRLSKSIIKGIMKIDFTSPADKIIRLTHKDKRESKCKDAFILCINIPVILPRKEDKKTSTPKTLVLSPNQL